jgi:toxin-antitoxin system PIN domain toxin
VTLHLCDANVWLALAVSEHVHHEAARTWLDSVHERRSVLFCRATQQSLLRLLTTRAVLAPYWGSPLTNVEAWDLYDTLIGDDRIVFRPDEPPEIDRWRRLFAIRTTASPKLWMDAYLAAFARAAGCQMVTADSAFRQFTGMDLLLLGSP